MSCFAFAWSIRPIIIALSNYHYTYSEQIKRQILDPTVGMTFLASIWNFNPNFWTPCMHHTADQSQIPTELSLHSDFPALDWSLRLVMNHQRVSWTVKWQQPCQFQCRMMIFTINNTNQGQILCSNGMTHTIDFLDDTINKISIQQTLVTWNILKNLIF